MFCVVYYCWLLALIKLLDILLVVLFLCVFDWFGEICGFALFVFLLMC